MGPDAVWEGSGVPVAPEGDSSTSTDEEAPPEAIGVVISLLFSVLGEVRGVSGDAGVGVGATVIGMMRIP